MKTIKPLATISYNSDDFLKYKLKELNIEFYAFINHFPEEGEKIHKHLYIDTGRRIETEELRKELEEDNENGTLKCLPFRTSKFQDWYLYALHDKRYLESKGQKREYEYRKNEIITNETEYLNELITTIDLSKITKVDRLLEALDSGLTLKDLILKGYIPINNYTNYRKFIGDITTDDQLHN